MIIVLEGLEGVGKTTLSQATCPLLQAKYVKTPPPELNPVRSFIAGLGSTEASFYFYLAGLFSIQEDIRQYKKADQHIILDRYIHSTIAYHSSGTDFVPPQFDGRNLVMPDVVIHITCSERVRTARVLARGFHLFDRVSNDDSAIKTYFASNSDFEHVNIKGVDESAHRLTSRIHARLSKKV
jgi:dTMP kinase